MTRKGTARRSRWGLIVLVVAVVSLASAAVAGAQLAGSSPPELVGARVRSAVDTLGLEPRSAALLLSGQEGGDLEISVLAVPIRVDPSGVWTLVVVDLEGASAPSSTAIGPSDFEVYAYALASNGRLAGYLTQAFRLDPADAAAAPGRGVKFLGQIQLEEDEYSLRVLVRERPGDRFGLRMQALRVGGGSAPLLLLQPADAWLVVRESFREEGLRLPYLLSGRPLVPAADLRIRSDEDHTLLLSAPRAAAGLEARFSASGDTSPTSFDLQVVASGEWTEARLLATLLPAGPYRLEVSSGDGSGTPLTVASVTIEGPPPLDGPGSSGQGEDGVTRSSATTTSPSAGEAHELAARYLRALQHLVVDVGVASAAVGEVERAGLATGGREQQHDLIESQRLVASILAEVDPRCLVPLIALHEGLYRAYHRGREYLLATHSRHLLAWLTDEYAARDRSPATGELIAHAFVSLAGYQLEVGAAPEAEQAFVRALEHDPQNAAALEGLASIHEAYGDYGRAVGLLAELLEIRPAAVESRLRFAVNLGRLGRAREAVAQLERCLDTPAADWIHVVAYQELARSLVAQGRARAALDRVEQGVRELPFSAHLFILRAALLDRLGLHAESRRALAEVELPRGLDGPSPRLRYSQWPERAPSEARQRVADAVTLALPLLGPALERARRRVPLVTRALEGAGS